MAELKQLFGRIAVTRDTTENWGRHPSFIPKRGEIVVYEDYRTVYDELNNPIKVPAIKIGDGKAYLPDLPFCDEGLRIELLTVIQNHTGNTSIHVSPEDRAFWNNKLNYEIEGDTLRFVVSGNIETGGI